MQLRQMKLERLSICSCGFPVLKDEIPLGTEYTVDIDSVRYDGYYYCGGCRHEQHHIALVDCSQLHTPGLRPLPYDLFRPLVMV